MIFGINIILLLGIINMILILIQVIGGLRIMKISFKVHKFFGIILLFTAIIHAIFAVFLI